MEENGSFKTTEETREEMRNLLKALVNIDSGSYTVAGVAQVARTIEQFLAPRGFACEYLPGGEFAPHLKAVKQGAGGKNVLFLCHMDTVFPEGTAAQRPFALDETRAYGPGACDMKAGIVCLLFGLAALLERGYSGFGRLTALFTSDEERGSLTSKAYIEAEARKADLVLVMEAGTVQENGVVIHRQGGGILNLRIRGRAAHAGANPQDGAHALEEMARKLLALHALTDYAKGRSVSVGVIHGGTRSNIIPDYAEAEIDFRCASHADGERLLGQIRDICAKSEMPGISLELEETMYRPPIEKTPQNQALYALLQRAAKALGRPVSEKYSGGGSDGNYTSALGLPTLDSLGPAGEGEHTAEEWVSLESLYYRTELLVAFLPLATAYPKFR